MNLDQQVNFVTKTDGRGYWSTTSKTVRINRVELAYVDEDTNDFGELRAYFDPKEWNISSDGLIYTDSGWMNSFKACMSTLGFGAAALEDVGFSEQGMQGYDYVSMDVGGDFLRECEPMYRWLVNGQPVNEIDA